MRKFFERSVKCPNGEIIPYWKFMRDFVAKNRIEGLTPEVIQSVRKLVADDEMYKYIGIERD